MSFPEYTGSFAQNDAGTQSSNVSSNVSPEIERTPAPQESQSQNREQQQAIREVADLEKAILRQEDYTRKTQTLSEQRKAYESEKQAESKYYNNLHWDLLAVANNPNLASKFLETYPEKFHSYLKDTMSTVQRQNGQSPNQSPQSHVDIELMQKVQRLEKSYNEQQEMKATSEINGNLEKYSKVYKDAHPEIVLARVYESHTKGAPITSELWEATFKTVDQEMKQMFKDRYGSLVKEQKAANQKGRDVDGGTGTITSSPKKFANIGDVSKHAIAELTRR